MVAPEWPGRQCVAAGAALSPVACRLSPRREAGLGTGVTTAFLGPRGTFSEEAALRRAGDPALLLPFPTFSEAVAAAERGEAEEALLPVENSIEGAVSGNLDIIIHRTPLKIRGELVLPVRHFLVGPPGATLAGVRTVISHPQPFGQCRRFLEERLPGAEQVAALSTAAAVAEAVASGDPTRAGIGTRRAADLAGGVVLAEDLQDNAANATRFVALGATDAPPTGDDKTSIGFTTHVNVPGSLHAVLTVFADAGLQLTRIESRPLKNRLGEYVFLVDFEGHRLDPRIAAILDRARERCLTLDVYGSYPRFTV